MSATGVTITVNAVTEEASRKLQALFEGMKRSAEGSKEVIAKVGELLGVAVSLEMFREFRNEYILSAQSAAKLEAALRSTGQASAKYSEELERQRIALTKSTGVENDKILAVQRQLIIGGVSAKQIEELTALTLDYAEAVGIDVTTAALQMQRALGGEHVSLRGVRLEIDRSLPKYQQVSQLMEQLSTKVGGQAAAAFNAAAPEVTRFHNALQELEKTLGRIAASQTAPYLEWLAKAFDEVREALDKFNEKHISYGEAHGVLGGMQKNIDKKTFDDFVRDLPSSSTGEDLFAKRMNLLELQKTAGFQAATTPSLLADVGLQQSKNENLYKQGLKPLSDYLAARRTLITNAANLEVVPLRSALAAITADLVEKRKALEVVQTSENFQQREQLREELDKLDLQKAKLEEQIRGVEFKRQGSLQEQGQLEFENPTSMGGAFAFVHADYAKQFEDRWKHAAKVMGDSLNAAISSVSQGITGLIEGTMTWSQALKNIASSILGAVIDGVVRMFAAWVIGQNASTAAALAGQAATTAGELAKQAATLPGALVKMLATAVGEGGWAAAAIIAAAVAAVGLGIAYAAGAFAEGGRPPVGEMALVGERGPELFVPDRAGTILPANQTSAILSGRGNVTGGTGGSGGGRGVDLKLYVVPDKNSIPSWARSRDFEDHVVDIAARNSYRLT